MVIEIYTPVFILFNSSNHKSICN